MVTAVSSQKCLHCGLVNFSTAEACRRCGVELVLADGIQPVTPEETVKERSIPKRALTVCGVVLLLLFVWYLSLFSTSDPLTFEQKRLVHKAIDVIEERGFAGDAFLLRYAASYRASDNWWNRWVGHADAYAATNFPFEVVTLYPDFFKFPVDDVERAAILLHESRHLAGAGEPEAFAEVWREKGRLGWTGEKYHQTRVWKNTREFTAKYLPHLFRCGADGGADCTE